MVAFQSTSPAPCSFSKMDRLSRWSEQLSTTDGRSATADPAWATYKKQRTAEDSDPQLNEAARARWERWEAATKATKSARTANRMDAFSSEDSYGESAEDERVSPASDAAGAANPRSLDAFRGFGLIKAVDHFGPLNGSGPTMTIEALDLTGGTEQTLLLGELKMTVLERAPAYSPRALPETVVTVYKGRGRALASYERIYSLRALSRKRPTSVDDLAATSDQAAARTSANGDADSVAALLQSAARAYGTSAAELVDAVRDVAPAQVGEALARLVSCHA